MPVIEFYCQSCDRTTDKIIPMRNVAADLTAECSVCGVTIPRILYSKTLAPHFYGNPVGYDKPSPTKRFSTKLATSRGNKDSMG
jgi:putative FmdB family regulatory protein